MPLKRYTKKGNSFFTYLYFKIFYWSITFRSHLFESIAIFTFSQKKNFVLHSTHLNKLFPNAFDLGAFPFFKPHFLKRLSKDFFFCLLFEKQHLITTTNFAICSQCKIPDFFFIASILRNK